MFAREKRRPQVKSMRALLLASNVGCLVATTGCASIVDRLANKVEPDTITVTPDSIAFHQSLRIVDLHADPLLLGRDLLERHSIGQVDIPRLTSGNVWLQGFGVLAVAPGDLAKKSLLKQAIDSIHLDLDLLPALARHERWPVDTRDSLLARVVYQAARLQSFETRSIGRFRIIENQEDLESYFVARARNPILTAGFLGLEGGDVLVRRPENVQILYDAGFRVVGLVHFHDNKLGGSSTGVNKGGLTPRGRRVLKEIGRLHMIVDLAHASETLITDVLAFRRDSLEDHAPGILVSHTGVNRPECDNLRNLSVKSAKQIVTDGGHIGIAFFKLAVCGEEDRDAPRLEDIVNAIEFIRDSVDPSLGSLALGSDWDGMVAVPMDASQLGQLTHTLRRRGFTEEEIKGIMGENAIQFLQTALPPR